MIRPSREYAHYAGRKSVPVSGAYDLLLVATAHDEYRSHDLLAVGVPVVDTRNLVRTKSPFLYGA